MSIGVNMGGPGSGRRKTGGGRYGKGGIQYTATGRRRKGTGKGRITSGKDSRLAGKMGSSITLNRASKHLGIPVGRMTTRYKRYLGTSAGKAQVRSWYKK